MQLILIYFVRCASKILFGKKLANGRESVQLRIFMCRFVLNTSFDDVMSNVLILTICNPLN